jgi:hypothetical protein
LAGHERNVIWHFIWYGFWTGLGLELQFFLLWVIWKFAHSKLAHRIAEGHWAHKIFEYFEV